MGDLLQLAARVEALDGPDRKVDGLIAQAFDREHGPREHVDYESRSMWTNPECAQQFTGSLDAAMTLTPGKDLWCVGDDSEGPFARITPGMACGGYLGSEQITVFAATPALALTAACLRAVAKDTPAQRTKGRDDDK